MTANPFAASGSKPGHGKIIVALLPPSTPVLQQLAFQYPLKLIAPPALAISQHEASEQVSRPIRVHTVFLLTYGGGLVGGDAVHLEISLAETTRLILLTQGSTKIFKSPAADVVTRQQMSVTLGADAALCYLPDPVQPFADSVFEQEQIYHVVDTRANLCVCDWVCEGRPAREEKWAFHRYRSKNEVWWAPPSGEQKLMLRDQMILDSKSVGGLDVAARVDGLGVFGTLILCGSLFQQLGKYFMDEFQALPRIGAKQWDVVDDLADLDLKARTRANRVAMERSQGLLWTSSRTRGFVVVKFGAKTVEGARIWLKHMITNEGTVEREFGERALMCLR